MGKARSEAVTARPPPAHTSATYSTNVGTTPQAQHLDNTHHSDSPPAPLAQSTTTPPPKELLELYAKVKKGEVDGISGGGLTGWLFGGRRKR